MAEDMNIRSKIVGSWQLLDHYAFLPLDGDNRVYPLGGDPIGIIIFTQDGHMATHMVTSESGKSLLLHDHAPSYTDPAFIGSRSTSYAGLYSIDVTEDGIKLNVHVQFASLPDMIGSYQQRTMWVDEETNGTTLHLQLIQPMRYFGEDRVVHVRWQKASPVRSAKS